MELEKKLAGNTAKLNFWINDIAEGFNGSVSPKHKETLFALLYLYFTQPRKDFEALNTIISKEESKYSFYGNNPRTLFYDTLQKIITQNNPRVVPFPTKKDLQKVDLDKIFTIYQERTANAGDYTFFLVGNFKIDSLKSLIEKYIGSLPGNNTLEEWKNVDPNVPQETKEVIVKKGMEPQSFVALAMNDKIKWNFKNNLELLMMNKILNIRLRKKIREEESEVYGINVSVNIEKYAESEFTIICAFGCNPESTDKLVDIIFDEFEKLKINGPTHEEMQKVHSIFIRDRETQIEKNRFWINYLEDHYFLDNPLLSFNEYKEIVNSRTAENLQNAAKKYLSKKNYVKVVLKPEQITEKDN
jgi:zinc protease